MSADHIVKPVAEFFGCDSCQRENPPGVCGLFLPGDGGVPTLALCRECLDKVALAIRQYLDKTSSDKLRRYRRTP